MRIQNDDTPRSRVAPGRPADPWSATKVLALLAGGCALLCACVARLPPGYPVAVRPTGGVVEASSGHGRVLCVGPEALEAAAWVAGVIDAYLVRAGEAIGFTLVERVGRERLRVAAQRGRVVAAEVLDLAGVRPDGAGL